jgi:hypothetical protein
MHGPAGLSPPAAAEPACPVPDSGFTRSDHHLSGFADKPIERTVSVQLSGYLGQSRLIRSRSNWI